MSQVRPYRGVEAPERHARRRAQLLAAGLDLLGGAANPDDLTVRAICRRADVTARYFYESFADKDALVEAVFDWVVADVAATTQAAVAAAPAAEQTRAGLANIVRIITADARVGRLIFSTQLANAVLMRKRVQSGALFAMLSGEHVGNSLHIPDNDRIRATAHFVVGGVGQTISAWLAGAVQLSPEQLVDQLTAILGALSEPRLVRD